MRWFGFWDRSEADARATTSGPRADDTASLCDRAIRGDRYAWNTLIRRFELRVWQHVVYRYHTDEARADEVCQETWLRLTRRLDAQALPYLRLPSLAFRQAWYIRFERDDRDLDAPIDDLQLAHPGPAPDEQILSDERRAELRRLIDASLSPRQREVILLRLQRGYADAEIAAALGISLNRVRELNKEAYARLRASWKAGEGAQ